MPSRSRLCLLVTVFGAWLLLRVSLVMAGGELGRSLTVRAGGRDVAALVFRGDAPARTLVVASHGGLASKETLLPICWEARRRGADCVLVDALGHGASDGLPEAGVVDAMRRALRVEGAVGPYADVRYVGHSMGAYLGSGAVYPCDRSIAIGQPVACDASRIVWGRVHRALGLPDTFYVLSHVFEPWTPSVVRQALSRLLPGTSSAYEGTALRITLAWSSLAAMMLFGVLVAKQLRTCALSPALRGIAAAAVLWCALALGAWRTVWFLVPTQANDVPLIAGVMVASVALAGILRRLGARAPVTGVVIAAVLGEGAALLAWHSCHLPLIGSLLVLMPLLHVPLTFVVGAWERISRGRGVDLVESAAFSSALLGTFLAMLLPGR